MKISVAFLCLAVASASYIQLQIFQEASCAGPNLMKGSLESGHCGNIDAPGESQDLRSNHMSSAASLPKIPCFCVTFYCE